MSVLLTAPQRLSILAKDSDDRIKYATDKFVKTLDSTIQLPAVLIDIGDADYPPQAASVEYPEEIYTMLLVSGKYGQGAQDKLETTNRELALNIQLYFLKRTQLQFPNRRGLEQDSLPPLANVRHARTNRSRGPTVLDKEGFGPFWGCEFKVAIAAITQVLEELY